MAEPLGHISNLSKVLGKASLEAMEQILIEELEKMETPLQRERRLAEAELNQALGLLEEE